MIGFLLGLLVDGVPYKPMVCRVETLEIKERGVQAGRTLIQTYSSMNTCGKLRCQQQLHLEPKLPKWCFLDKTSFKTEETSFESFIWQCTYPILFEKIELQWDLKLIWVHDREDTYTNGRNLLYSTIIYKSLMIWTASERYKTLQTFV